MVQVTMAFNGEMKMHRLFIAIDLPEEIKGNLGAISYGLPGARWVASEQVHLTLRFVGEVDGSMFEDIGHGLAGILGPSFSLTIKGLGFFPPRGQPRVLWAGLEASEDLKKLKGRVDGRLRELGLAPDGRKFSPHITLARLRGTPRTRLADFLAGYGLFSLPPFAVDEFHLYSSVLTPGGAVHQKEASYPLI